MRRAFFYSFLKSVLVLCFCEISFVSFAEEPASETTVMKIDLDDDEPAGGASENKSASSNPLSSAAGNVNSAIDKAKLDEKRSRLREQLKRDRADSKRARSIRRNAELNRDGLDEDELELKKKLDYARSHDEGEAKQQEATESAKQFSKWVNQNMMINKDKKKKPEKSETEKVLEEARTSEDLLN